MDYLIPKARYRVTKKDGETLEGKTGSWPQVFSELPDFESDPESEVLRFRDPETEELFTLNRGDIESVEHIPRLKHS